MPHQKSSDYKEHVDFLLQRKTIHEKSKIIIYEFSYKMGVLNEV